MIEERKNELVAALRSGKYQQSRKTLRNSTGFCCLGVACDISGISEWDDKYEYDGCESILPKSVMEYYGFCSSGGWLKNGDEIGLAKMNDAGKSFDEIADFIDAHWQEL